MSSEKGIIAVSVRRPYLAALMSMLIVIAGIGALFGIEVRELPDVDRPVVSVRANHPGASPTTVDAEVASLVEGAVARAAGVKSVRTSSEEGNFRLRIEFSPDRDLANAANDVREAVARVENRLPPGVTELFVVKSEQDARPIIDVAVWSEERSIDELTRLVEDAIVTEMTAVDGVAEVALFGHRQKVIRVAVRPDRLAAFNLSISEVADVLRATQFDVPVGSFSSGQLDVLVRADATVAYPARIEDLMLRDRVRLGDVADVYFALAAQESVARLDGRLVISLGIIRQAQSNTVQISAEVNAAIERLKLRFPDLGFQVTGDDAVFIKGAITEVLKTLGLALVIVIAVMWVFFGRLSTTLRALIDEDEIAELTIDDRAVPIILQSANGAVRDSVDLLNLYVRSDEGELVPLTQIVSFEEISVAAELDRHAQRQAIEIEASVSPEVTLRDVIDDVRALAQAELPDGIGLIFLGDAASLDETSSALAATYIIALIVVFLVLLAQFESLTSALVVMLTVPFGVCAAIYALLLTGTSINIYSQIGVLMLIGVMAKNGILLVEFADRLREKGTSAMDAAHEAALERLRPIMMTLICTVMSGLPLILGSGPGAESRAAIGWVIVGGLGLAVVFTLFLTPAAYGLVSSTSRSRASSAQALEAEMRDLDTDQTTTAT